MAKRIRFSFLAKFPLYKCIYTVPMKMNERYFQELREKIKKRSNDIHELQTQNESAKKQVINMLKEISLDDFTEKAEHFLELLLHTEQVIEVLRHDFSELALSANCNRSDKNLEASIQKFQSIENDILKTAKLVGEIRRSISGQ